MNKYVLFFVLITLLSSCDRASISKFFTVEEVNSGTSKASETKNFTGVQKQYYDNGQLKSEVPFKDGKINGLTKTYYDDGKEKLTIPYENGVKQGTSKYYYESGKLYRETPYLDNKIHGVRKVYSRKGLQAEIPYYKGTPCKGLKEYYLSGKLKTKYPSISVSTKDDRMRSGHYLVYIQFTQKNNNDEFWIGDLESDGCTHDLLDLNKIPTSNGVAIIDLNPPKGAYLMQKLKIIGKHITKQGNPYITTRQYNLVIE